MIAKNVLQSIRLLADGQFVCYEMNFWNELLLRLAVIHEELRCWDSGK
jgi:hypothetical protein